MPLIDETFAEFSVKTYTRFVAQLNILGSKPWPETFIYWTLEFPVVKPQMYRAVPPPVKLGEFTGETTKLW